MSKDFLLIGVDGGATKVSGWSVDVEGNGDAFVLGDIHSERSYGEMDGYISDFKPVDINVQLSQMQSGSIALTEEEKIQGRVYVEATAEVIRSVVKDSGINNVLIGIGMPGLKTEDQRGIAAMANGPRIVNYCSYLENLLYKAKINVITPIAKIGSDAYYCGIGEEYAREGQFKEAASSYYLGGGTGAADALKVDGQLLSLDDIKDWFVKTWEMKTEEGYSLERYVSSRGIQLIYGELVGMEFESLDKQKIYPSQIREMALNGDRNAVKTFEIVTKYLALLLYERITTLNVGWQGLFSFVNPNKQNPSKQHPFIGGVFDSIIIGQRLGDLLEESRGDDILWNPLFDKLYSFILNSNVLGKDIKAYYCPQGRFSENLLKISKLREAPALGAGVDAYLSSRKRHSAEELKC